MPILEERHFGMERFKKLSGPRWWYYYLHSFVKGWPQRALFAEVKTFVLFVGYPRSGHSLIGSLLDAHPNVVISNQLNALYFFQKRYFRHQIYHLILRNATELGQAGRKNSGYDYAVPNQWQGRFKNLRVMGDKRGGGTARMLHENDPEELLTNVPQIAKAQLKIIHVIRNPFDNISTMVRRGLKTTEAGFTEELFQDKVDNYFFRAQAIEALRSSRKYDICDIYLENFIAQPKKELQVLCDFLQVEATEAYLDDCASIIWPKPHHSRHKADFWSEERTARVEARMKSIDFLQDFTF